VAALLIFLVIQATGTANIMIAVMLKRGLRKSCAGSLGRVFLWGSGTADVPDKLAVQTSPPDCRRA